MIRPATEADIPAIRAIYAPYVEKTTITFEYTVPTEAEFLDRFRAITQRFPWLVWEEEGEILGYVYASAPFQRAAYDWCAEPSVYLRQDVRGRGIGTKLYAALEALLQAQGFQVLLALITEENTPSLDFHSRCGYVSRSVLPNCGFKFGRWLGVTWMEKRLYAVEIPSAAPTPWSAFGQDAQRIHDILDILSLS